MNVSWLRIAVLAAALLPVIMHPPACGQIPIAAAGVPVLEHFDSIGVSSTATLPVGWRAGRDNAHVRSVGSYTAASGSTAHRAGNGMGSGAANGVYNFASGDPASAADRAVGFLASGYGTKSGTLHAWYHNATGGDIGSIAVAYTVEKYRRGRNAAGFSVQLHASPDGASWSSAGTPFSSFFPSDASDSGYAQAPGDTVRVSDTLSLAVPAGGDVYLAWNYSVASGTSTGNAQALAIDDVSIRAIAAPPRVQFADSVIEADESAGAAWIRVSIANPSRTDSTIVEVALTGGTATNGSDVVPAFTTQRLAFPPGDTTEQRAGFTLADDSVYEGDETLVFRLQNVSGRPGSCIGTRDSMTFIIRENDALPIPPVVVNEYFNANGDVSTYEAIELLVLRDSLDMRGWTIADGAGSGSFPHGSLTLSQDTVWAHLPGGAIILIGGTFAVQSVDDDPSDGVLLFRAPAEKQSNRFATGGNAVPSIAGASDAVGIFDTSGRLVHGLAHGSAHRLTFPAFTHGWTSASAAPGESVGFSRTGEAMRERDFLGDSCVAVITHTLGGPNDSCGNRDVLRRARSRVISSDCGIAGTFYWDVAVAGGTVDLHGPVAIGNMLTITGGTVNERGLGLSLLGNANAQNGIGAGSVVAGDDAAPSALLAFESGALRLSGTAAFDHADATVRYDGTSTQAITPASYFNLSLRGGSAAQPKVLDGPARVDGTLAMSDGALLRIARPHILELGPAGMLTGSVMHDGSIRTRRVIGATGASESFGGIGVSIRPSAAGRSDTLTATVTRGEYTWVGDRPSILRRYALRSTMPHPDSLLFSYDDTDLNGQDESSLAVWHTSDDGATWSEVPATPDTATNTFLIPNHEPDGIWTMHASPPQGILAAAPDSLVFEAEQDGVPPDGRTLAIGNAIGRGSIVEWTARAQASDTTAWLETLPGSARGVNSGTISVRATRTDLPSGRHTGTVSISDAHAVNSPLLLPVSYFVHPPRRLCVDGDTIVIKALVSKNERVSKPVCVRNCGGVFGADSILWEADTRTSWLSVEQDRGVEGQAFLLTARCDGMPAQTLHGAVTITGTLSLRGTRVVNSPLVVPVRLEIEPLDETTAWFGAMRQGETRIISNALGHRIAAVTLVRGPLGGLSARVLPRDLPQGVTRFRPVARTYAFDATTSGYAVDLTLYYTANELRAAAPDPAALRGWRQHPAGGVLHATAGTSNPFDNSVTIRDVTDLAGVWILAAPYAASALPLREIAAHREDDGSVVLHWSCDMRIAGDGYIIERTVAGREQWRSLGMVRPESDGRQTFTDTTADARERYAYRLVAFDAAGDFYVSDPVDVLQSAVAAADASAALAGYALGRNYPNPCTADGGTTIRFAVPTAQHVTLTIHDSFGRIVRVCTDGVVAGGEHFIHVAGRGLRPGVYFYRLGAGGLTLTRRMLVLGG